MISHSRIQYLIKSEWQRKNKALQPPSKMQAEKDKIEETYLYITQDEKWMTVRRLINTI